MTSLIIPVTAKPYLGSLSSMLCPPIMLHPALCMISKPPFKTSDNISKLKSSLGHETSCKEDTGVPPIA